jgi:dUTP pyrophosphatase
MNKVKFLRCDTKAILPTKAYSGDQCFDLYSIEDAIIYPGETVQVKTGLKCVLPAGYGLEFKEKSGLASKGLKVGGGIIDNGYRGLEKVIEINLEVTNWEERY